MGQILESLQSLFEWHLLILYGEYFPPNVRPSSNSVLSVPSPERESPTPGLVHRAKSCSTLWVFNLKMNESFWVLSTHFFFFERVQARKLTDISERRCSSLPENFIYLIGLPEPWKISEVLQWNSIGQIDQSDIKW